MKAISVREPYASLIMDGKKTIETRTWTTNYRGKLLICASKYPRTKNSGKALCVVDLVKIRPMIQKDELMARCEIYPNAQSWIILNRKRIKPFPVKGQLGLFEVPDSRIEYVGGIK